MRYDIIWMIIGMGMVTYIPRMLPLAVFHRVKLPPFLQGVLKNVPYAILGALIVPGIFLLDEDHWFGVLGFVSAVVVAWFGANIIIVVLASVLVLSVYAVL
ncbi:branched-chain amino acid transport family protein [Anoxybacillus sp. B7M1]|uniref:AzlD domain-containing protein n=1 Tax=unclassified Anoxybacillus TaxID=2639704 RepID=UPI0005CDA77E|nr:MULTISPECIES: AzlD domain-containing protein [unclassified Anoxybacillus]ANB56133.1 branched-chain amino acid transport family protein [Anoxybacillus sp. B2M1]ANB64826.1 branched-chain amino acid transport family protein [Anoxybacillus sp. B7M1]